MLLLPHSGSNTKLSGLVNYILIKTTSLAAISQSSAEIHTSLREAKVSPQDCNAVMLLQ